MDNLSELTKSELLEKLKELQTVLDNRGEFIDFVLTHHLNVVREYLGFDVL